MKNMPPPVAVKSKLLTESPSKKGGKNVDFVTTKKQPVCPKPLRPVSSVPPEVLSSLRCSKHRNSCFPNDVILNLTDSRVNIPGHNRNEDGHDQSTCTGCSTTPYYSGSPPGRTNNPLIYDAEFVHQMEMLSPFSCKNLQDKPSFTSASQV